MSEDTASTASNKLARLIRMYDLEGIGAELERKWRGEDTDRLSLRALAELVNQRVLEAALRDAGLSPIDYDVESVYANLTDDDVSQGVRAETRTRLRQDGVDVEQLERDFISYQTVRTYLMEVRGVEYERQSDTEKVDRDIENLQRLLSRTVTVTEDRLEKLRATDRLAIEDFEVLLDAQVLCQRCGTQHEVIDLLEHGGCACLQE